jgi:hypothetical protein
MLKVNSIYFSLQRRANIVTSSLLHCFPVIIFERLVIDDQHYDEIYF